MVRPPGLIIAAPATASGKTTVTLGLLRHLRRAGRRPAPFKIGPDYIDPAFHAAAAGRASPNLDPWAMRAATLGGLVGELETDADIIVGEGVMGLFDGAPDGSGSTADLAALTGWPVVLVVDVAAQAASVAAVVHGFASLRDDIRVAGVVLNRVASDGHRRTLLRALEPLGIPVLGCLPKRSDIALPHRHLGLVQSSEHEALDTLLDGLADLIEANVDGDLLLSLVSPANMPPGEATTVLPPPSQRIAVAGDDAFRFAYPHCLAGWRRAGAEIAVFSPLAGDAVPNDCDAVFLPGGYPELHAGRLADNAGFMDGLRAAAARGAPIYGECGGYMVLGDSLTGADGTTHRMAGLLPLETSFTERRLHLGYRAVTLVDATPFGPAGAAFRGHEFHYTTVVREDVDDALFMARDGRGGDLGRVGARRGSVMGSFIHLIDSA